MIFIKRRIIKQGHDTLTLTLPKSWCSKHQVKAGEELEVEEEGEILNILPNKNLLLPEIVVDVRGLTPVTIWRHVASAYRAGYDQFRILFDNIKEKERYSAFSYNTLNFLYPMGEKSHEPLLGPIEVIQAMINRCIGVEIIDQKENWCIVRELGETTYKEFDNALRRIFLLLLSLSEETMNYVKNGGEKEILKSIHIIDTNIDRFTDFCLRVLNKKGYREFRKTTTMYSAIFLLEMIGDEYKKIAIHLMMGTKKASKNLISLFEIQYRQLRRFYNLFYNFNKDKCIEVYEEDTRGKMFDTSIYENLNSEEKEILHHLKKIGIYLTSLTELRIDLEF